MAGGGDTVAALNQAGVAGDFTYVSTAGGGLLEWWTRRTLMPWRAFHHPSNPPPAVET